MQSSLEQRAAIWFEVKSLMGSTGDSWIGIFNTVAHFCRFGLTLNIILKIVEVTFMLQTLELAEVGVGPPDVKLEIMVVKF